MDWMGDVRKRGTKDSPWSRTRAVVWMVVPSARWETPEEKVAGQTGELSFRHIEAVMLIQYLGRAVEQAAVAVSLYFWEGPSADGNVRAGRR